MITGSGVGRRGTSSLGVAVWAGPAVIVAVSGLLYFMGTPATDGLAYHRAAIAQGQWWRLLTCNFVHLGFWHYFLNALSLLLWIFLCGVPLRAVDWCLRVLVLGLGVGVGLYFFVPDIDIYVGLSGMIYGLFLLDLGRDALVEADRFALLCVVFLIARVSWEAIEGTPSYELQLIGGPVVSASHFCGMVAAVLYGTVGLLREWRRRRAACEPFRILGRDR